VSAQRRGRIPCLLARPRARVDRTLATARSTQGMTLVELMIVVMVIAIMAGAFGSSVRRTMLEQRMGSAAREIVRLVRDAKLRASVLRVAHAVRFDPGNVRVRVLRAPTNSCIATNWVDLDNKCSAASEAQRALGRECLSTDFGSPPWTYPQAGYDEAPTFRLREALISATTGDPDVLSSDLRTICFSPNGTIYHGQRAQALTDANKVFAADADPKKDGALGGGFLFHIDLIRKGEPDPDSTENPEKKSFVARQVLVPLNGLAKVLR
jgi:prepilin-type N-terminal cleavage/methylation domain-containing protein